MYTGHFAAALVLKAKAPKTSSWALFAGVALLDFLWAVFTMFGVEVWNTHTVQMGWSHSLLGALCWAVLFAACFYRRGWRVCAVIGAAVFSHFVLDWPVHKPHLPLYPYSTINLGLGLGQDAWGPGWWLELAVILSASAYYLWKSSQSREFGRYAWLACGMITTLHFLRAVLRV